MKYPEIMEDGDLIPFEDMTSEQITIVGNIVMKTKQNPDWCYDPEGNFWDDFVDAPVEVWITHEWDEYLTTKQQAKCDHDYHECVNSHNFMSSGFRRCSKCWKIG